MQTLSGKDWILSMTSSYLKTSVSPVHTNTINLCFKKSPLWRAFWKTSVFSDRKRCIRVNGRLKQRKKSLFSKISGYVWTGPLSTECFFLWEEEGGRLVPKEPPCVEHGSFLQQLDGWKNNHELKPSATLNRIWEIILTTLWKGHPKLKHFHLFLVKQDLNGKPYAADLKQNLKQKEAKPYACKDCKNCSRSSSHCNLKGATVICGLQTPAVRLPELA